MIWASLSPIKLTISPQDQKKGKKHVTSVISWSCDLRLSALLSIPFLVPRGQKSMCSRAGLHFK